MMIEGLRKSNDPRMQQKSFILAQKWILANYHVFQTDNVMWEKYDVASIKPQTGGGGEYNVQAGFGWTNGVALDLLVAYGDRLTSPKINNGNTAQGLRSTSCFAVFVLIMTTLYINC
ncbi:hypothetical protein OESDEN_23690 [Oesophagostomum dentatum]|uniref:Trehalase n=1 Tax=Oesophagostomum dentatum TaxID=61180 RepID=A0A0B1S0I3_OESDE|nr:hypothetical protein OESDEN_23690 [Oesophagostomum dentatum]